LAPLDPCPRTLQKVAADGQDDRREHFEIVKPKQPMHDVLLVATLASMGEAIAAARALSNDRMRSTRDHESAVSALLAGNCEATER